MMTGQLLEPRTRAPLAMQLSRRAVVTAVRDLRAAAQNFAERVGAPAPVDVALAVSEAVTNSVLHAYGDAEPGPVHLTAEVRPGRLVVTVTDEGSGLHPRPDSPGLGLGLPTIGQLTEELEITGAGGCGVRVEMSFAFPSYEP
jgi:serine/threonine-protein kinase RsbW/stage II sporulation protein AB (anti-sigma F factor)